MHTIEVNHTNYIVSIKHISLNGLDCDFILITRRDKRRMGRRFISRGADLVNITIYYLRMVIVVILLKQNKSSNSPSRKKSQHFHSHRQEDQCHSNGNRNQHWSGLLRDKYNLRFKYLDPW